MAIPERYSPRLARRRCAEAPSALLLRGVEEFNQQRFFEAHETWEEDWRQEKGPQRDLLRGLIHMAAGYHHLVVRQNHRGAFIKLGSGARLLDRFGRTCRGLDLDGARRGVRLSRDALLALGPGRTGEFDRAALPQLRVVIRAASRS